MSKSIRVVVVLILGLIGVSFVAPTAMLMFEFWHTDWLSIANFYSHIFVFFPIFGLVTLLAIYTPVCVLADAYVYHVPSGRTRSAIGLIIMAGFVVVVGNIFTGAQESSIYEVSPKLLVEDVGYPPNCKATGRCSRLPVLSALDNVRRVSQARIGLTDLTQNCQPDVLIEWQFASNRPRRYCFTSTPLPLDLLRLNNSNLSTNEECCRSRRLFTDAVSELRSAPGGRSLTSQVQSIALPFRIFYIQLMLVLGFLLINRKRMIESNYSEYLDEIELGLSVSAGALIIYPIMIHAFLVSSSLLYFGGGPSGGARSSIPISTTLLCAYGLMVFLQYAGRRLAPEARAVRQMALMLAGGIVILKYEYIIDFTVRLVGSGAGLLNVALLCLLAIAMVTVLLTRSRLPR